MPLPHDDRSFAELARRLRTTVVGQPLWHFQQVESTNDLVRAEARAGRSEGLAIMAEEQASGRGRLGRGWAAPPGSSLLFSLLLRPSWLAPEAAFLLTMLAAVSLCEAVEAVIPVRAALKWPNDLMLPAGGHEPRKSAGILSELSLERGRVAWAIIGIGVNVNWSPAGLVDGRDLAGTATSLSAAVGHSVDRLALLSELLSRLDERYLALRNGQREALFEAWAARLVTIGQHVSVRTPGGELRGQAEGVDSSGALQLREANGALHTVTAGDVGA